MKHRNLPGVASATLLSLLTLPLAAQEAAGGSSPRPLDPAAEHGRPALLQWGDFDADGLRDVLAITPELRLSLMRNTGDGLFEDVTRAAGLDGIEGATLSVWQDYDQDGQLDLFVGTTSGAPALLRNLSGSFHDVTQGSGIDAEGLDRLARFSDYDADGRIDLHLVSGGHNLLFHATEGGGFERVELPAMPADYFAPLATPDVVRPTGPLDAAGNAAGAPAAADPAGTRRPVDSVRGSASAGSFGGALSGTTSAATSSPQNILDCAATIADANTGACLSASATATLGMLYPLSDKFFVEEATGEVGIGTTSPSEKLHVVGNSLLDGFVAVDGFVLIQGSNGLFITGWDISPSGGSMHFNETGFGTRLAITPGGDVGIGTTTPSHKLEVEGDTLLDGSVDVDGALSLTSGLGMFVGPFDVSSFAGQLHLNETNVATRLAIDTGGEVGIGTTSPTELLHVQGGNDSRLLLEQTPSLLVDPTATWLDENLRIVDEDAQIALYSDNTGGANGLISMKEVNSGGLLTSAWDIQRTPSDQLKFNHGTNNSGNNPNMVTLTADGRMGIGTEAPDRRLSVVQDVGNEGLATFDNPNAAGFAGAYFEQNGAGKGWVGHVNSSSGFGAPGTMQIGAQETDIVFSASTTPFFVERMRITGSGNVGIGTSAPVKPLHISSNTNWQVNIEGNNNPGIKIDNTSGTAGSSFAIYHDGNDNLNFRDSTTGATRMVIRGSDGRMGIKTETPSFDLHVNGTAGKPGGGSWSVASDRRLKRNVQDLEGALDTLLALRGVTFEYKDPEAIGELAGERIGFIAQEVEEVLPDWIEETEGYKRLSIRGFSALAVEALRELQQENAALEARVAELEAVRSEVAELKEALATLAQGR